MPKTLIEQGILHPVQAPPGEAMHTWPVRVGGLIEEHRRLMREQEITGICLHCGARGRHPTLAHEMEWWKNHQCKDSGKGNTS